MRRQMCMAVSRYVCAGGLWSRARALERAVVIFICSHKLSLATKMSLFGGGFKGAAAPAQAINQGIRTHTEFSNVQKKSNRRRMS